MLMHLDLGSDLDIDLDLHHGLDLDLAMTNQKFKISTVAAK